MRFLVDACLPRKVVVLLRERGHEAQDVRDIGLRHALDPQIAATARERGACLITADRGFGNVWEYPPQDQSGIVVLRLPKCANSPFIVKLLEDLLVREDILERLPGRLAIVEPGRIRLRPA